MNLKSLLLEIDYMKLEKSYDKIKKTIDNNVSPLKELLYIYSNFGKLYSINKENRNFLINYYNKMHILYNWDEQINIMIIVAYIDAQYKNYNYLESEVYYRILKKINISDFKSLLGLSEYMIVTRRYNVAEKYLREAKRNCTNNYYLNLIQEKFEELEYRKEINDYLPATLENRKKYIDFMDIIGIDVKLHTKKRTSLNKIGKYPIINELFEAGFKTFVAFDVETTGINHYKDSIIEIAAIRVIDGVINESDKFIFQELVHPYNVRISNYIEKLTGITNEMIYESREISQVFNDFADWVGDDLLVGYNCISFDSKFIAKASLISNRIMKNQYFDVMKYARSKLMNSNINNFKLVSVAEYFKIENPQAHRALADAITTAKVYNELLKYND